MRILLLGNADNVHTQRWANGLSTRGHEIHLAHIAGHESAWGRLDRRIVVHRFPFPGTPGYYLNAVVLRRLVSGLQPDVTHAHYASGYGTLARMARIPYLLSVWGSDVYDFPYRGRMRLAIVRRNLSRALALSSTSYCMAIQVRRVIGDPRLPITVIPFGVDLGEFDPSSVHPASRRSFTIGVIKTLAETYGIDVLIKAAAILRDRTPELMFAVRIYGDGPLRHDLQRLVGKLELGEVVRLLGPIPHDKVPSALGELDVFCATSLRESFGVAVLEAMAMCRPVVVSDTEGFAEVVGSAGLLVPCGDAEATASALARLAGDHSLRATLGRAGRLRAETEYNWEVNLDQMLHFYATYAW